MRQLMTPAPYTPPTRNAAFLIDGITMMHSDLLHRSSGIPLSGELRSSFRIAPASLSRFTSSFDKAANAEVATNTAQQMRISFFILDSPCASSVVTVCKSFAVRRVSCIGCHSRRGSIGREIDVAVPDGDGMKFTRPREP